jgi:hypothetical protein
MAYLVLHVEQMDLPRLIVLSHVHLLIRARVLLHVHQIAPERALCEAMSGRMDVARRYLRGLGGCRRVEMIVFLVGTESATHGCVGVMMVAVVRVPYWRRRPCSYHHRRYVLIRLLVFLVVAAASLHVVALSSVLQAAIIRGAAYLREVFEHLVCLGRLSLI